MKPHELIGRRLEGGCSECDGPMVVTSSGVVVMHADACRLHPDNDKKGDRRE